MEVLKGGDEDDDEKDNTKIKREKIGN